uniref:SCP domain-containing protein n=1 Tax=Spongospora subterranea TaxID=70186 RepID=A0A0H5RJ72_9EUKA|eukprot:CRZ08754.1 hypothetical protein [Spongospora subterranea]
MSLMGGSLLLLSLLCIAGSVDVSEELPSDDWVNKRMSEFKHECDQIRLRNTAPMSPDVLHMTFKKYYEPGKQVCKAIANMGDGTDIFSSDDAKKLITDFMWTLRGQVLGDKGIAHYTALLFSYKTVMSLPKFWGLKGERMGF